MKRVDALRAALATTSVFVLVACGQPAEQTQSPAAAPPPAASSPTASAPPLAAAPQPTTTIKEFMETTITDASNVLWNAYDPPTTDEQWAALEQAALTMIEASAVVAAGGTGPMDNEWVREPAWKPFNDAMRIASEHALEAIRARDHEALLTAGDELYAPCEACHMVFNPGVVNAQ